MRDGPGILNLPPPLTPLPRAGLESSLLVALLAVNFFETYCGSPVWAMEFVGLGPLRHELPPPLDDDPPRHEARPPRRLFVDIVG